MNAARQAKILNAFYTHHLILTAAPETADGIKRAFNRMVESIRNKGRHAFEYAWSAGWNPAGTGVHVHALIRGSDIDVEQIQECATRAGFGLVILEEHGQVPGRNGKPLFEGAWYVLEHSVHDLDLNSGRLCHLSRGMVPGGLRKVLKQSSSGGWVFSHGVPSVLGLDAPGPAEQRIANVVVTTQRCVVPLRRRSRRHVTRPTWPPTEFVGSGRYRAPP